MATNRVECGNPPNIRVGILFLAIRCHIVARKLPLLEVGRGGSSRLSRMPLYHYYFSASPGDPSPRGDGLATIEADSPTDAIAKLERESKLPPNWQLLWVHFLVWVDQEGQQRGFESIPLSSLNPPPTSQP